MNKSFVSRIIRRYRALAVLHRAQKVDEKTQMIRKVNAKFDPNPRRCVRKIACEQNISGEWILNT